MSTWRAQPRPKVRIISASVPILWLANQSPGDSQYNLHVSGGITALNGGAAVNPYNSVGDFLLGQAQYKSNWVQIDPQLTLREWQIGVYARDQWQATHNLTINYGVRWEHCPVPTSDGRGIEYNNLLTDLTNPTMQICGIGGNPGGCGISLSNKLFSPR
ncbi:MAG: hypothetical protein ABI197_08130 [Granulicella sp.]